MTIEAQLTRIADALETIAGKPSKNVIATQPPVDNDHVAPGAEKFSTPAEKPPVKTRAARALATALSTPVANPPAQPAADPFAETGKPKEYTQVEVRAALVAAAAKHTQPVVLAKMKEVSGADTLPTIPPAKYAAVVAAVEALG